MFDSTSLAVMMIDLGDVVLLAALMLVIGLEEHCICGDCVGMDLASFVGVIEL